MVAGGVSELVHALLLDRQPVAEAEVGSDGGPYAVGSVEHRAHASDPPKRASVSSASVMMRSTNSLVLGRSSMSPTTWPLAITPARRFPSTSAALRRMGVLAACSICAHDSSCVLRIARPSRTI